MIKMKCLIFALFFGGYLLGQEPENDKSQSPKPPKVVTKQLKGEPVSAWLMFQYQLVLQRKTVQETEALAEAARLEVCGLVKAKDCSITNVNSNIRSVEVTFTPTAVKVDKEEKESK